jgi:hypothetical protein
VSGNGNTMTTAAAADWRRPTVAGPSTLTRRQPFDVHTVAEKLCEEFVGREEVIRSFLEMLRATQSISVCGRCSDKTKIVIACCKAAGLHVLQVDCNLLENSTQLYEYILSRLQILVDGERTEAQRRQKQLQRAKGSTGHAGRSLSDHLFGKSSSGNTGKGLKPDGATPAKKVRKPFARCARPGHFIKHLNSIVVPSSKRPHRDRQIAIIFTYVALIQRPLVLSWSIVLTCVRLCCNRNATALHHLDRSILPVFTQYMPQRIRIVCATEAPSVVFLQADWPTLHVPFLPQVRFTSSGRQ